jgi:hypothetical protein
MTKQQKKSEVSSLAIKLTKVEQELDIWRARALFYAAYSEFNFRKVHKAMSALDWRWGMPGTVPTVEELQNAVMGLLDGIEEAIRAGKPEFFYSCGGIECKFVTDARELTLQFTLTDITTYADVFTEEQSGVQFA